MILRIQKQESGNMWEVTTKEGKEYVNYFVPAPSLEEAKEKVLNMGLEIAGWNGVPFNITEVKGD